MKLYIIRHGETSWNVQRRLQGASDTDLNENGITLAKRTGEALKEIPFDLCFTSPLKRAKMTAELILAGRDISIYDDERLLRRMGRAGFRPFACPYAGQLFPSYRGLRTSERRGEYQGNLHKDKGFFPGAYMQGKAAG